MSAVAASVRPAELPAPAVVRKKRRRLTSFILPVFTILMIVYLAEPGVPHDRLQLQRHRERAAAAVRAEFTCCTFRWWQQIADLPELNTALRTSILVAIPTAFVATSFGSLIGLVLGRYRFSGRRGRELRHLPRHRDPRDRARLRARSRCSCRSTCHSRQGSHCPSASATILLSHIGFSIAFVAITVRARVSGLDDALESAAQDLYATPIAGVLQGHPADDPARGRRRGSCSRSCCRSTTSSSRTS